MPNWIKKSLVVLISIITFGMVTPNDLLADQPKDDSNQSNKSVSSIETVQQSETQIKTITSKEEVIQELIEEADVLTQIKLGDRILPRIENEFQTIILPKMEQAIQEVVVAYPNAQYQHLIISPSIGKGDGERIFNIMDEKTGEDVIRFHVRRDQPPLEGYSFNFHYHSHHDGFESHHTLATVYWGKDTPAKFGSKMVH
ncbi:YpjP family protein [Jeotgalibacillus soli]|uniref:YpjP-like protein n=1 Tax=Jeotgalibacillus soli TaxID=889306 RepID=A0A0C2V547_9BACL|nr:YpjP family protein [Jeotgalibacillus soli]KIL44132.1 hypothetical protein KP78_30960 [Jeotgalibacillus soli]